MAMSNERAYWLALIAFTGVAVGIMLWKNSSWSLEILSFKELRYLEVDGFIAPLILIAAIPARTLLKDLVARLHFCEQISADFIVFLAALVFSVAFSLSAMQQNNLPGRICAAITLLLCGPIALLGLGFFVHVL